MPTGYTADVAEGKVTDFRTFALRCARQFGALMEQRDEPMDSPPRLLTVSEYTERALRQGEAEVARLQGMSLADAAAEQEAERLQSAALTERMRRDHAVKRERYEAMLAEVERWRPPTAEHEGLRTFMLNQLGDSLRFDCDDSWIDGRDGPLAIASVSPAEWLAGKKSLAYEGVSRAARAFGEERARVAGANRWIEALWASLEPTRTEGVAADAEVARV